MLEKGLICALVVLKSRLFFDLGLEHLWPFLATPLKTINTHHINSNIIKQVNWLIQHEIHFRKPGPCLISNLNGVKCKQSYQKNLNKKMKKGKGEIHRIGNVKKYQNLFPSFFLSSSHYNSLSLWRTSDAVELQKQRLNKF